MLYDPMPNDRPSGGIPEQVSLDHVVLHEHLLRAGAAWRAHTLPTERLITNLPAIMAQRQGQMQADIDQNDRDLGRMTATARPLRTEDKMRSMGTNENISATMPIDMVPQAHADGRTPRQWRTRLLPIAAILITVLLVFGVISFGRMTPGGLIATNPDPLGRGVISGIDMLSTTNGWAVGDWLNVGPQTYTDRPLLYHFDGTKWTDVMLEMPQIAWQSGNAYLNSISLRQSGDGWAVGGYGPATANDRHSLLYHFDGKQWTISKQSFDFDIEKVQVLADGEAWASSLGHEGFSNEVLHYDGTSWHMVPLNTPQQVEESTFTMISPQEGWLLGSPNPSQTEIFHYSQGKWSEQQLVDAALGSISMTSPVDGWAVGTSNNALRQALYHYSNGQWQVTPTPAGWTHVVANTDDFQFQSPALGWAIANTPLDQPANPCQLYIADLTAQGWSGQTPLTIPRCGAIAQISELAFTGADGWAAGWYRTGKSVGNDYYILVLHLVNGVWTVFQEGSTF